MKNYLLPSIAIMLAGSLALSCNKDKNDEEDGPFDPGFSYDKPEIIHLDEIIPIEITESTFPDPVFRAIISTRDYDKTTPNFTNWYAVTTKSKS